MKQYKNILTRGACLSSWVTEALLGEQMSRINFSNQQTVRVDLFFDILDGKIKPAPYSLLQTWITNKGRLGVYKQTEDLLWLKANEPELLIMDNYSEIVDKRFEHWTGIGFCGLYGDIDKKILDRELAQYGSLDPAKILPLYDRLFQYVKDKWNIPIIFVHFPTVFDPRERYRQQGEAITNAMGLLAEKYQIQNIHADESEIEQKDADYYHFSERTVSNMAGKIII